MLHKSEYCPLVAAPAGKGGMRMFPYHNRIKQRIKAGELVDYEFVNDYPRIGEALCFISAQSLSSGQ